MCHLQVPDVKWLLIDVGSISSSGETPHTGQVATVASHSLNDEHTSLGSTGRLLDAVTGLTQAKAHNVSIHEVIITRMRHLQFNIKISVCLIQQDYKCDDWRLQT